MTVSEGGTMINSSEGCTMMTVSERCEEVSARRNVRQHHTDMRSMQASQL